ncbi:14-3-3 domain-containing protein [Gymnopilus junonius]|uniref:14-3-3 domain-containing protein n=1 Tax=Gymnopilus junonius TaxID=109634 RepID=A0A9P5NM30_GYMJU|nr:14-3-3 domain-containing protein [Gymnopilus junonius]
MHLRSHLAALAIPESRKDSIYLTKIAEQAGHYEETVESMRRIASSNQELTVEGIVSSIEQEEKLKGNEAQAQTLKAYRVKIESELTKIYEDILNILNKHLTPSAASGESEASYYKAISDYC